MLKKLSFSPKLKGLIFLGLSTLLWAGSFLASRILKSWPLETLLWGRFLGAFGLALPFLMTRPQRHHILNSLLPGLLVATVIGIQTWALRFESVSVVAFLSSFYFIFVTLFQWGWRASWQTQKVRQSLILALLALILFYAPELIPSDFSALSRFSPSITSIRLIVAMLLVGGAVLASFHILWVEHLIQNKKLSPFPLAMWGHGATAATLSLLLLLNSNGTGNLHELITTTPFELSVLSWNLTQLAAFIFLTLGSTFLAFWLQFLGQRYLTSTEAGFVFILEAPLATLLAYLWGWEVMGPAKLLGMFLFITALVSILQAQAPPK